MKLSHDMCYQAIKAQDARFDGVFFTAVKTTGIYCRPICKVRAPKPENCVFYDTAAKAEANGYRPCLRCRPELAPGYADSEQMNELMRLALNSLEEQQFAPKSIQLTADALGISTRHLSRIFQSTLGVSPQAYIMTKRLLLAKSLLTDTNLPITEIALLAGFGSVSRFNAAFKNHYRLTPTSLRKSAAMETPIDGLQSPSTNAIQIKLAYRPPYNWPAMMAFFRMRAIEGVEWVTDEGIYRRSIIMTQDEQIFSGWIEVKPYPEKNIVVVTLSRSLEKVLLPIIKRIRTVFDLDAMPQLLPADLPEGIRLPGCFDAFEMSTRAILGQQVTVKAAKTLAKRLVSALGTPMESPFAEINVHFPTAQQIHALETPITEILGPLGVIKSRSCSIAALATSLASGDLQLTPGANPDTVRDKLLALSGIGPWTAEYLTMRALSWPDAFPVTDIGVKNALMPHLFKDEARRSYELLTKHAQKKCYENAATTYAETYRPWRSYLTIALWHSLSSMDSQSINE